MNNSTDHVPVPYDLVLEETRLKLAIAKQHLSQLQEFGMNQRWLNDLEKTADQAEQFATDNEQVEELKSLTAAKNVALAACVEWATKLRFRMDLIFEEVPPTGMQFPNKKFQSSRENESKMITLMPSLIKISKSHQAQLKTVGQTEEMIEQGETLLNQLKEANEQQEEYKFTRTTTTLERRKLFKTLYDGVNYINRMGQMVYGADSANGLQFRSNWPSPSTHQSESSEVGTSKGKN